MSTLIKLYTKKKKMKIFKEFPNKVTISTTLRELRNLNLVLLLYLLRIIYLYSYKFG